MEKENDLAQTQNDVTKGNTSGNLAEVGKGDEVHEDNDKTEACEELIVGAKRGLKSIVWQHFTRKKIGSKMKAICNYCKRKLGGEARDGTNHLHGHMKICIQKKVHDAKQGILGVKVDNKGKSLANWEYDEELVRRELACMIAFHEYPMVMVEHYWFRRFMSIVCPKFKTITRNTAKSDILKVYEQEMKKLQNLLDNNDSKIAITTDMWTATHQKKGFMAITAHFIDESWTLQSKIIKFLHVPCPHTAAVLSSVLFDGLMDWNIDHKVSALSLDNCSTNDAMIDLLYSKLTHNSLWLDRKLMHVRCSAHILNLIVKDGLGIIDKFIENVRESVSFWTTTPKRYEKFEEVASQLKIPLTKKIALDCKTRWNSTYHMLNVAISYKDVFMRLAKRDNTFTCPLKDDWDIAQNICEKLKIFHAATEFFSGTNYPTANLFLPKICDIRLSLRQWSNSSLIYIRDMALKMIEKFDKYWTDFNPLLSIATVLDPRYKFKVLEYYLPLLHGDIVAKAEMEKIKTICYELVAEYSKVYAKGDVNSESNMVVDDAFDATCLSPPGNKSDEITSFDDFVASNEKLVENIEVELDHYLEEHLLPRKGDFDLLAYWKTYLKYPVLRLLARDVFAIPMSTVASESAFSTGGRVICESRSNLNSDTVEALMCLRNWLQAEVKDSECIANDGSLLWDINKDMDSIEVCDTTRSKKMKTV